MPNYEEIIQQSQTNLKSLGEKLKDLDKLHQDISALKKAAEDIPSIFNLKYEEIVKLSTNYITTLGGSTEAYLDGNNLLFTTKLQELTYQIKQFEKEIDRLLNTDFALLFEDLQKKFIAQTREDFEIELRRFEEKSKDLKSKIDELKNQIDRLANIDLEKHFDKFQKTLSEIFGAINATNLTLTNTIQTLTHIVQSIGNVQNSIDSKFNETHHLINTFSEATTKHLIDQDKEAKKDIQFLSSQIKSLAEQNDILKKAIKINRIIQIIGLTIIVIISVYMFFKNIP